MTEGNTSSQRGYVSEQSTTRDSEAIIGWVLIILAVVALGLIGYGFYLLFTAAPPELMAAVVVTVGTILGSILAFVFGKHLERNRTRQQKELEQRERVYKDFMNFWLKVLTEEDRRGEMNIEERIECVRRLSPELIAWGSDAFLDRFLAFKPHIDLEEYRAYDYDDADRSRFKVTEPQNVQALLTFEEVLYTIRSDLTAETKKGQQGGLLKMFLKEEKVDAIIQASQPQESIAEQQQLTGTKEDKSRAHT